MTGGDTQEGKIEAHGADTQSSWPSGYITPLLFYRGWFEPRGGYRFTKRPEPPFFGREGERERDREREREREGRTQWERNREEQRR